jgi:hypothetical protein
VRALGLAALLALVLVAPASAQDRGEPVVGGGSFGTAPVLKPGRYHDTILPGEYLYYGFQLAAGQSLHVTLTHPDIDNIDVQRLGVIGMVANIHTPARTTESGVTPDGDHRDLSFGVDETDPLVITGPTAEADADDSDSGEYLDAGVYYLALHPYTATNEPPRAEIPFTFEAEIRGTAEPNVTPEPTATETATASPTATPRPPEQTHAGPSGAVAAIGGVAGILIGVLAGIARRGRRR